MFKIVKAYQTSDGAVLTCRAEAAMRELCILLGMDYQMVMKMVENDEKVISLLQETRKEQPSVRRGGLGA